MISLGTAFAAVLTISFLVFILFFGRLPALQKTPIGALNRLLSVHIPQALIALDQAATGGRLWHSSARWVRFMMNEKHPTVLILFILLMLVPEFMVLPALWPSHGMIAKAILLAVIISPYTMLCLAVFTNPGKVNEATYDFHSKLYPYDHINFDPGRKCSTCNIIKPARSKHCSICRICVSRSDHHCIFINNCVGYNNLHYFILLLVSTSILTATGTVLGTQHLLEIIDSIIPGFTFAGSDLTWSEYIQFWTHILHTNPKVGSVTLLCLLVSPLVWGLTIYQMYLIWAGTTTNETSKWANWKSAMDAGIVYARRMPLDREMDPGFEPPVVGWPKRPEEILVKTRDGLEPDESVSSRVEGEGPWERVWSLREVENVYDIGFVGNFLDVFWSRESL